MKMTLAGIKRHLRNAVQLRKIYGWKDLFAISVIFILKRTGVSREKYLDVLNRMGGSHLAFRYEDLAVTDDGCASETEQSEGNAEKLLLDREKAEMVNLSAAAQLGPAEKSTAAYIGGTEKDLQAAADNEKIHQFFQKQQEEDGREEIRKKTAGMPMKPLISVIMLLGSDQKGIWLKKAIGSLLDQYYENWELCAVDHTSPMDGPSSVLQSFAAEDPRIKYIRQENTGISDASNAALKMAAGTYVAFLDQKDELTPDALFRIAEAINLHPDAEWFYPDEAVIDDDVAALNFVSAVLKPEWSPELLLETMYTGHFSVYKKDLVERAGGFRSRFDLSRDYDLALRLKDEARGIIHVERILYLHRNVRGSDDGESNAQAKAASALAVKEYFARKNIPVNISTSKAAGNNVIRFLMGSNPPVGIIIPSDSYENIVRTVNGIIDNTSYPNYEIVVVCDSALGKQIREQYPFLTSLRIVPFDGKNNFSGKCNAGAAASSGSEIFVFCQDDICPQDSGWLNFLVGPLWHIEGIGGISPRILYEDGTTRYAGMFGGFHGLFGTCFHAEPADRDNPDNRITKSFLRNVSILSGSCAAVRKTVFERIGGFNEKNTPDEYSAVDLSFRLLEAGFRNVYSPHGALSLAGTHSAAVKKNKDKTGLYMIKRWGKYLSKDPYYTPSQVYFGSEMRTFPEQVKYYVPDNLIERVPETRFDVLLVSHEMSVSGAPMVLLDAACLIKKLGGFPVIVSFCDGALTNAAAAKDIPVIINPGLLNSHVETVSLFRLFAGNFDAVIANTTVCCRIAGMLKDSPAKVMTWIHEGPSFFDDIRTVAGDQIAEKTIEALSDSSFLCAVNQEMVEFLKSKVTCPVDLLRYALKENKVERKSLPPGRNFVFLTVASIIEPRKGFDVLVRAYNLLDEEIKRRTELWCVGSENNVVHEGFARSVRQMAGGNPNIRFLGNISQEEVLNLTAAADVMVAPSREDPCPLTITQSMMLSKPCICSSRCGTASLIRDGENGLVFENENIFELALKMRFCMENRAALDSIGKEGRKIYERLFVPSVFEKHFIRKLNSLIPRLELPEPVSGDEDAGSSRQPVSDFILDTGKKISIISCCFNTEIPYLKAMIDSVLSQTYPNWELCLLDCSDDEHAATGDVTASYAEKDPRIKVVRSANRGIAMNSNCIAGHASGEYLFLLDHDDLLEPDALSEMLKFSLQHNAGFVYADEILLYPDRRVIRTKKDFSFSLLWHDNFVNHPVLFKKSLFDEIGGFREGFEGSQDYDLYLRILEKTNHFGHIRKPLYVWRIHNTSFSQNRMDLCIASGKKALSEYFKRAGINVRILAEAQAPIFSLQPGK